MPKRTSKLRQIANKKRSNFHKAISAGGNEAIKVMAERVPVDDGDLKSTLVNHDNGKGKVVLEADGPSQISDEEVDYHIYQEFGTDDMSPEPYFRPGVHEGIQKIKEEVKKV